MHHLYKIDRSIIRSEYRDHGIGPRFWFGKLAPPNDQAMTTGRKFSQRTNDNSTDKVLDHRTRTILNAIMSEPRGKALGAYLRTIKCIK